MARTQHYRLAFGDAEGREYNLKGVGAILHVTYTTGMLKGREARVVKALGLLADQQGENTDEPSDTRS